MCVCGCVCMCVLCVCIICVFEISRKLWALILQPRSHISCHFHSTPLSPPYSHHFPSICLPYAHHFCRHFPSICPPLSPHMPTTFPITFPSLPSLCGHSLSFRCLVIQIVCLHACVYLCMCAYVYPYPSVHTCIRKCISLYVYLRVCMCACWLISQQSLACVRGNGSWIN